MLFKSDLEKKKRAFLAVFLLFFQWKEPIKDARAYGSSRAKYLCEIPGVTEKKLFFPSDFSKKLAFLAVFCPFFGVF